MTVPQNSVCHAASLHHDVQNKLKRIVMTSVPRGPDRYLFDISMINDDQCISPLMVLASSTYPTVSIYRRATVVFYSGLYITVPVSINTLSPSLRIAPRSSSSSKIRLTCRSQLKRSGTTWKPTGKLSETIETY